MNFNTDTHSKQENTVLKQIAWLSLLGLWAYCAVSWAAGCCAQQGGVCGDKCCDQVTALNAPEAQCGAVVLTELERLTTTQPAEERPSSELTNALPTSLLYIWHSESGQEYYSTTAPHWYRNPNYPSNYPQIQVYDEYHRLVDDTAFEVPKAVAQRLKRQARIYNQEQQEHSEQQALAEQERLAVSQQQQALQSAAEAGEVKIGMSMAQVEKAWGQPTAKQEEMKSDGAHITWFFDEQAKRWVKFVQGKVTNFRTDLGGSATSDNSPDSEVLRQQAEQQRQLQQAFNLTQALSEKKQR